VRYAETDQMAWSTTPITSSGFELARTRLCLEAGLHYAEIESRAPAPGHRAQLTYRAPARYGETVSPPAGSSTSAAGP